ncbi:MAG TPA: hypothetical protein PK151_05355 [Caldisericia bacterium]|nr:hypothetical protein [Caldisericia bacterium]
MTRLFHKVSEKQLQKDGYSDLSVELPKRGTKFSAGYDFFCPLNIIIEPEEIVLIPTGIKVQMEADEVLQMYPRSSLGFKYGLMLLNTVGIVDSDYFDNIKNEGHIWVKYYNPSFERVHLKKGDAFCQGVFQKYLLCDDDNTIENGRERIGGLGSTSK